MKAFWKTSVGLAAMLFALALPLSVSGSEPVTLPHQQHWENFAVDGSPIGTTKGWYGETNLYAVVTNLSYTWTLDRPELDPPAPSTNRVLRLDTENSSISNVLANTGGNTNVVVDVMIQFVPSPDEDAHGIITNDNKVQAAYYVNTNGYLVVYHLNSFAADPPNVFSVLDYDCVALGTTDWARVTLEFDYQTCTSGYSYYRIALNGNYFTNAAAATVPDFGSAALGGEWFVTANFGFTPSRLDAVTFSGTGYLDDYRVSGDAQPPLLIEAWVNDIRGGRVLSLDGQVMPRYNYVLPDGGTNFMVVTSNHWALQKIETNLVEMAAFHPATNYFVFTNVNEEYSVYAEFLANTTEVPGAPDVPDWWLGRYFPDSNVADYAEIATSVYNNVGMAVWQEYWAGTDPTDSNSVLRIDPFEWTGSGWRLRWPCDYVDVDLPPYLVQRSTNLVEGVWDTVRAVSRTVGTRSYTDYNAPTNGSVFYRVTVDNTP